MMQNDQNQNSANAKAEYHVSAKDLPLCCPMPGMSLWNAHPRVYLPIEQTADKIADCPYCGARYVLEPGATIGHH